MRSYPVRFEIVDEHETLMAVIDQADGYTVTVDLHGKHHNSTSWLALSDEVMTCMKAMQLEDDE